MVNIHDQLGWVSVGNTLCMHARRTKPKSLPSGWTGSPPRPIGNPRSDRKWSAVMHECKMLLIKVGNHVRSQLMRERGTIKRKLDAPTKKERKRGEWKSERGDGGYVP